MRKTPYENPTFFLGKLYQKNFVLHSTYTGNTTLWVWFDLNNSLTQWKRLIFKIRYLRNSKISVWNAYEKLTFFLGKL